ncbi:PB1 domain-containing protein/ZZ domain-containing protein [Cephalotus follicularis]|uniref:PB1 domain-containing protein/ZZ domain-containing protein n=1 Tax=Cephalotus follicularis TaxID=3775 RepID=A0A1Q3B982_CEPFO|nr:PB1 domain-containing protein/ZZ domain-containing protein [Cephalotus follicularis]
MESTLVIKVKYGDTLRRFNARVYENELLELDMSRLRSKILGLFNFPPDAGVTLTYVDEDGDVVTLVDDDDLCDVTKQCLKILRINVQLNDDKYGKDYARSSGSSTPLRSPQVQHQLPNLSTGVAEVLNSVPEPFREAFSKLSVEFASKATSSGPLLADLVEIFTKMGKFYLNPDSQPLSGTDAGDKGGAAKSVGSSLPFDSNPSKVCNMQEVLPKSNSTSKPSQDTGNVSGVGASVPPVNAAVDLNQVPPCASNPSGYTTMTSAPATFHVFADNRRKDAKKHGVLPFVSSTSSTDPVKPSYRSCLGVRRSNRNEAMGGMFHRGVQCDGCGVHPITGPRYKSKVREDFDLCSICFSEMGNEADYIKIVRPMSYRHSRPFKHPWIGPSPLPPIYNEIGIKHIRPELDSRFIQDVNVLDGTIMAPSTPFTKIWRMRNNGGIAWPQETQLVWIGGDRFSDAVSAEIQIPPGGVPVDGELDIAVDFTAPELPGRYISYWRMMTPSVGKFGQRVWVLVQVDSSLSDSFCDSLQSLNLNLPPPSGVSKLPEAIDVNVHPDVSGAVLEPSDTGMVKQEPVLVVEQPQKDLELNFPINDSLLVGDGVLASARLGPSSPVSYPIIDLSDAIPAENETGSHTPYFGKGPSSSAEVVIGSELTEQTLLKELEEMGFKQVDLNKEILRMNEYDLEQSVDDLCCAAEWDPILEELQEMGFVDSETNKMLLKKNNGSIKRVVMDLLSGEKA